MLYFGDSFASSAVATKEGEFSLEDAVDEAPMCALVFDFALCGSGVRADGAGTASSDAARGSAFIGGASSAIRRAI